MSTIAVLGAGAGGAAATAELVQNGYQVNLWNRSLSTLQPFIDKGSVAYEGVLGCGEVPINIVSADINQVVEGVDGILVCMPTIAHDSIAIMLAKAGINSIPVILNPGHTGGALSFYHKFVELGIEPPSIAEFSTLTYVARKSAPDKVNITGCAKQIRVAPMAGDDRAANLALNWFKSAKLDLDVISTSLSNVNLILHPPGSILGSAWVEATAGDFTFYVEGMTDGVAHVIQQLDDERRSVAKAYGHDLPSLTDEMTAIGTVESGNTDLSLADKLRQGKANQTIKAPDSLEHRYYIEDFWYGLMPFIALAKAVDIDTPVASCLLQMGVAIRGEKGQEQIGRTAEAMGIAGLNKEQITRLVRGIK